MNTDSPAKQFIESVEDALHHGSSLEESLSGWVASVVSPHEIYMATPHGDDIMVLAVGRPEPDNPRSDTYLPTLTWEKPMTSRQAASYLLTNGFVAVEYARYLADKAERLQPRPGHADVLHSEQDLDTFLDDMTHHLSDTWNDRGGQLMGLNEKYALNDLLTTFFTDKVQA